MGRRGEILQKLVEILETDSDVHLDNLDDAMSLREGLGLDSVDLVGVIMRIESDYRIRLSYAELEEVTTVGSLLDLIEVKIAEAAASPSSEPKAA